MDEGRKLLYSIIESKISKLSDLDMTDLYIDDMNIKDLYKMLELDEMNLYIVDDNVIDEVIGLTNIKNASSFRVNIRGARDLLIGRKEYNLKVNLTQEHQEAIKAFKKALEQIMKGIDPEVLNKEETLKSLTELKRNLDGNYLVNDFETIESITKDYDILNYDKNMVTITKYINDFNLSLIKAKKRNAPIFDIQMIRRPKIDPRVKEILEKLNIKQKEIPNFLISELKKCDAEEFIATYATMKKNKAENGGILHFIEKDNILLRLAILLYSTPDAIHEVVATVRNENEALDISLLKIIINNIPGVLLVKNNPYYKPKHNDYLANLELLKNIGVNYNTLIKRNPLFMIIDNKVLDYTLDYVSSLGANKKDVVNRCYKTLSIKPSLIIDNLEAMKKNGIDLNLFFNEKNTNYNLLKMNNLEHKLLVIKDIYDIDIKNIELLNKVIVAKVYKESTVGYINWGEEK